MPLLGSCTYSHCCAEAPNARVKYVAHRASCCIISFSGLWWVWPSSPSHITPLSLHRLFRSWLNWKIIFYRTLWKFHCLVTCAKWAEITLLWNYRREHCGSQRKFSWQTLKDTCQFFVNHLLTSKRYQNLNLWKFHVFSQLLIHRKEAKLPRRR